MVSRKRSYLLIQNQISYGRCVLWRAFFFLIGSIITELSASCTWKYQMKPGSFLPFITFHKWFAKLFSLIFLRPTSRMSTSSRLCHHIAGRELWATCNAFYFQLSFRQLWRRNYSAAETAKCDFDSVAEAVLIESICRHMPRFSDGVSIPIPEQEFHM